jgi:CrcB protein
MTGPGIAVAVATGVPERVRDPGCSPAVLTAISIGGALGALARYGLAMTFPRHTPGFPWATFATNVSGCLLIGVLMVVISAARSPHRLLRPLLGVGLLGGFTTFSTYVVETQALVAVGEARTGLAYLGATLVSALLAVYAGTAGTRLVAGLPARIRRSRRPVSR